MKLAQDAFRAISPFFRKVHNLLYYDDYLPYTKLAGEEFLLTGKACDQKWMFGANTGNLVLTNLRLLWAQSARAWPFQRSTLEIELSQVEKVHLGWHVLAHIFGGVRLHIRLRSGRLLRLWIQQSDEDSARKRNTLHVWCDAVREAVDRAKVTP